MMPVVLWTDVPVWLLVAITLGYFAYVRRHEHLAAPWRRVARSAPGMVALVVLLAFAAVGLVDSLHFRPALEGKDQKGGTVYAVEVLSLLDVAVMPLKTRTERTYSAPLAIRSFSKETTELAGGGIVREFPRLRFGGAHLKDEADHGRDVALTALQGVVLGAFAWGLAVWFATAALARRRRVAAGAMWTSIRRRRTDVPWLAIYLSVLALACIAFPVALLAGKYHVLGTDKVGQDVLYLSLKSIRTGLVIGTLTTLVTLPFAVLLGIMAGYFKGWIDDAIQYLYTTINSIPGVLLIAAAVLIMQVYIDKNPELFPTAAQRADFRLLLLCAILGATDLDRPRAPPAGRIAQAARARVHPGGARARRAARPGDHASHPAERDAHRADRAGDGLQRAGARRGGAFVRRRRGRPVDEQLRHHDQRRAARDGARSDGLVDARRGVRVHVRARARRQSVRRCGARRVRSARARWPRARAAGRGLGMSAALLQAEGLRTSLDATGGTVVRALDGVDLEIARGETFAIVGESGCGKSMTALTLMRLLPEQGRVVAGTVRLDGTELLGLSEARMRDVRGGRVAMIFQEPATSLNPVLTIGHQIVEVLERHVGLSGAAARARAVALLDAVGIADGARRIDDYPFQLSGGMKQRVMIALALAAEPELLIADEPTTALDVTIQAQVLDVLARLQRERGMSILLITHDLGVVAGMAHRVAVMYAGQIVESGPRAAFFATPQHPYARKLFAALPGAGMRGAALEVIPGQVPSLAGEFRGCRFVDRCDQAFERCRTEPPGWTRVGAGHARPLPSARARDRRSARGTARGGAGGPARHRCVATARGARSEGPFSDPPRDPQAHGRLREGRGRRVALDPRRPDTRARRGVGLREDDGGEERSAALPAEFGRGAVRRHGTDAPERRTAPRTPGGLPDRVPGSVRVPQPAHARARHSDGGNERARRARVAARHARPASSSCSTTWACPRTRNGATRTSSRGASASASRSRAPCR